MEGLGIRFIVLWIHFLIQDLKSNEPRLNDINKVADELLFEDLLTPEGAHIRQVITSSLHPSAMPAGLWSPHFNESSLVDLASYSKDQDGKAV